MLKCLGASSGRRAGHLRACRSSGSRPAAACSGVGARGDRRSRRFPPSRPRVAGRHERQRSPRRRPLQGMAVGLLVSLLFALVPLLEVRAREAAPAPARGHGGLRRASATGRAGWRAPRPASAAGRWWRSGRPTRSAPGSTCRVGLAVIAAALLRWPAGCSFAPTRRSRGRRSFARAPRGHQPRPSWQPDARDPDDRRPRLLLHPRRAGAPDESARGVRPSKWASRSPDLVLIDVQRDQVEGVRAARRAARAASRRRCLPLMRARVVGVDGRRVQLADAEAVREHGRLGARIRADVPRRPRRRTRRSRRGSSGPVRSTAGSARRDGLDTEVSIASECSDDVRHRARRR